MIEHPRVSIIIPTFNRSAFVEAAARSVVAQSFTDWELIVADDGSTDDTADVIRAIGDSRIRILSLPRRGQAGAPRNSGAAVARGEWLAFLDSDDLWLSDKLAIQMAALDQSGADWSYSDHGLLAADGAIAPIRAGRFAAHNGAILSDLVDETTSASVVTIVVRKRLFESLGGFDEALRLYEDLDFTFRLASAGRAVAVDEALTLVRDHETRTTRNALDRFDLAILVFDRLIRRSASRTIVRLARKRRKALLISGLRWHLRRRRGLAALRLLFRGLPKRLPS